MRMEKGVKKGMFKEQKQNQLSVPYRSRHIFRLKGRNSKLR